MLLETLNEQGCLWGNRDFSAVPPSLLRSLPLSRGRGVAVPARWLPVRPWACAVLLHSFICESSLQQMGVRGGAAGSRTPPFS